MTKADETMKRAAADELKHESHGAFFFAGIAVALILLGWLAFSFYLFQLRGIVG